MVFTRRCVNTSLGLAGRIARITGIAFRARRYATNALLRLRADGDAKALSSPRAGRVKEIAIKAFA